TSMSGTSATTGSPTRLKSTLWSSGGSWRPAARDSFIRCETGVICSAILKLMSRGSWFDAHHAPFLVFPDDAGPGPGRLLDHSLFPGQRPFAPTSRRTLGSGDEHAGRRRRGRAGWRGMGAGREMAVDSHEGEWRSTRVAGGRRAGTDRGSVG